MDTSRMQGKDKDNVERAVLDCPRVHSPVISPGSTEGQCPVLARGQSKDPQAFFW
jgi:hypothetical protein